jgi:hypothetical protein
MEEVLTTRSFINCSLSQISLSIPIQGELDGMGTWHAWERRENGGFCRKALRKDSIRKSKASMGNGIRMDLKEID